MKCFFSDGCLAATLQHRSNEAQVLWASETVNRMKKRLCSGVRLCLWQTVWMAEHCGSRSFKCKLILSYLCRAAYVCKCTMKKRRRYVAGFRFSGLKCKYNNSMLFFGYISIKAQFFAEVCVGWNLNPVFVYCTVAAWQGEIIDTYFNPTVLFKSSTEVEGWYLITVICLIT